MSSNYALSWIRATKGEGDQQIVNVWGPGAWFKNGWLINTPLTVREARRLAVELLVAAYAVEAKAEQ